MKEKETINKNNKQKIRLNTSAVRHLDKKYAVKIAAVAFFVSILFSFIAEKSFSIANVFIAILILLVFILIGIIFDIIGIAAATADEKPFHSMSSRSVRGALTAVYLVRNAGKVSNLCNDVIGDIASIISGSAGAALALKFLFTIDNNVIRLLAPLVITAFIAALTIGGKALGKGIAINHSNTIIFSTAKILTFFNKKMR